jgi:hypothetical protein
MASVEPYSAPGREKEGKKFRKAAFKREVLSCFSAGILAVLWFCTLI